LLVEEKRAKGQIRSNSRVEGYGWVGGRWIGGLGEDIGLETASTPGAVVPKAAGADAESA